MMLLVVFAVIGLAIVVAANYLDLIEMRSVQSRISEDHGDTHDVNSC